VKRHRPETDDEVAQIDENKHPRVGVCQDISDTLTPQPQEYQVRECVDYLGTVEGDAVILDIR
jgi:hypothetical protein